jgi:hypothetical protein
MELQNALTEATEESKREAEAEAEVAVIQIAKDAEIAQEAAAQYATEVEAAQQNAHQVALDLQNALQEDALEEQRQVRANTAERAAIEEALAQSLLD